MSKTSLALLGVFATAIVIAVYFEVPFSSGVSGLILLVALGYSYVVARREMELLAFAKTYEEEDGYHTVEPPRAKVTPTTTFKQTKGRRRAQLTDITG